MFRFAVVRDLLTSHVNEHTYVHTLAFMSSASYEANSCLFCVVQSRMVLYLVFKSSSVFETVENSQIGPERELKRNFAMRTYERQKPKSCLLRRRS